jgi:hypothetical protein
MLRLPHLEPHYTTPRHTLLEYDKVNFWPKRIKKKNRVAAFDPNQRDVSTFAR